MPVADPVQSVAAVLQEGARLLAHAAVAAPRREAAAIWAALADTPPERVWLERQRPATFGGRERFVAAVRRRAAGEPLAYVTGSVGFRTLDLAVDARVLIPRMETEGLVAQVLDWAAGRGAGGRVVDVGTGSGCIALSLAVEGRFRQVVAVEPSAGALAVAAGNRQRVAPTTPVHLVRGSLLESLGTARFDVVVANPPYVTETEYAALERGVRDFEPREALAGGPDGLGPTRALLQRADRNLRHGGLLALEIDCRRAATVLALARAAGWRGAQVRHDLFGRPRYLLATWERDCD